MENFIETPTPEDHRFKRIFLKFLVKEKLYQVFDFKKPRLYKNPKNDPWKFYRLFDDHPNISRKNLMNSWFDFLTISLHDDLLKEYDKLFEEVRKAFPDSYAVEILPEQNNKVYAFLIEEKIFHLEWCDKVESLNWNRKILNNITGSDVIFEGRQFIRFTVKGLNTDQINKKLLFCKDYESYV